MMSADGLKKLVGTLTPEGDLLLYGEAPFSGEIILEDGLYILELLIRMEMV